MNRHERRKQRAQERKARRRGDTMGTGYTAQAMAEPPQWMQAHPAFIEGQARYMTAHGFDVSAVSSAGTYQSVFSKREPSVRLSSYGFKSNTTTKKGRRARLRGHPDVFHQCDGSGLCEPGAA